MTRTTIKRLRGLVVALAAMCPSDVDTSTEVALLSDALDELERHREGKENRQKPRKAWSDGSKIMTHPTKPVNE